MALAALLLLCLLGGAAANNTPGALNWRFRVKQAAFNPDGVERSIIAVDASYKRGSPAERTGWTSVKTLRGPFGAVLPGSLGDSVTLVVDNALKASEFTRRMAAIERSADAPMATTVDPSELAGLTYSEIRAKVHGNMANPRSLGGPVGRSLHGATGPATSIHVHGMDYAGFQISDGPAYITQCPIPGNSTYTYNLKLSTRQTNNEIGLTWFHSHLMTQYTDGLWGIVNAQDPMNPYKGQYDEEIVVALTDWWHIPAEEAYVLSGNQSAWGPKGDPTNPDSILINGYGRYDCAKGVPKGMTCKPNAPWAKFKFTKGKKYLLRIINTSTSSAYWFSIDGHSMKVVQGDATFTKAQSVDRMWIDIAQRYSVIVTANKPSTSKWWMRVQVDKSYYFSPAPILPNFTYGIVAYEKAAPGNPNSKAPARYKDLVPDSLRPYYAQRAPAAVGRQKYTFAFFMAGTPAWGINYKQYVPSAPSLLQKVAQGTPLVASDAAYTLPGPMGKAMEIIIQSWDGWPHPWHIHGHTFFVLGTGPGNFTEAMRGRLETGNPMRRDTVTVPANGWAVLRLVMDNPGVWFSHCHIGWHLEGALAFSFNELPGKVRGMVLPQSYTSLCAPTTP